MPGAVGDEVGLLIPAEVDVATGYRRYHRDQAGRSGCRAGDALPIEEIRQVIDDPAGLATCPPVTGAAWNASGAC